MKQKVDRLSNDQVEALLRSLLGETSKRISISMEQRGRRVSPHTVDSWIRKALTALDVQTRDEAARIVARSDRAQEYQELISQSPPIVRHYLEATPAVSQWQAGSGQPSFKTGWPFPTKQRPENDDSLVWRILWPVIIAMGTIFAFSALYAVLRGWTELVAG